MFKNPPHRKAGEEVAKDTPEEEIKLTKTFAAYMDENQVKIKLQEIVLLKWMLNDDQELATMINKGKGKLKWERDMPRDIEEKLEVIMFKVIMVMVIEMAMVMVLMVVTMKEKLMPPLMNYLFCYHFDPT